MKHTVVTTIMLAGPLLWTTALPLPTSAQSYTTGSDQICLTAPVIENPKHPAKKKDLPGHFSGNASWYGVPFNGRKTASGEIFNMNKLTAAHRSLPMSTRVLVENPRNGKAAVIKVNDRGPYARNRIMDLSREGARQTGIFSMGIGYVECMVLPSKPVSTEVSTNTPSSGNSK